MLDCPHNLLGHNPRVAFYLLELSFTLLCISTSRALRARSSSSHCCFCSRVHRPAGTFPHFNAADPPAPAPATPPPIAQAAFGSPCVALLPLGGVCPLPLRFLSSLSFALIQRLTFPCIIYLMQCGTSRISNPSAIASTSFPSCPPVGVLALDRALVTIHGGFCSARSILRCLSW